MVRKMLEKASGRLTGSVYHDAWLQRSFSGEMDPVNSSRACRGKIAIKLHGGLWEHSWHARVCGGLLHRAIFLVRHPLRAALAEFQRSVNEVDAHLEAVGRRRTRRMPNGTPDRVHALATNVTVSIAYGGWPHRAVELARRWLLLIACHRSHASQELRGVWNPEYWSQVQPRCARDTSYGKWLATSQRHEALWVRYEDLVHESRAPAALERLLRFSTAGGVQTREALPRQFDAQCALCAPEVLRLRRPPPAAGIAYIVEAGGAAEAMWAVVGGAAVLFGYTRYNYDALTLADPAEAAAREMQARSCAASPAWAATLPGLEARERPFAKHFASAMTMAWHWVHRLANVPTEMLWPAATPDWRGTAPAAAHGKD
jgi:hypothetical protein